MDYDQENDNQGLGKGPFYGAAAFIFVVIALFASVEIKEVGTLGHWQIAACVLGTGLIAVFLFLPHFIEGIAQRLEDLLSNQDADSTNKTFFELKEIRSELDTLALKVDKVPTLVNKIVSDSLLQNSNSSDSEAITDRLNEMESALCSRLEKIEDSTNTPLQPATDPVITELQESVKSISSQLDSLQSKLESLHLNKPAAPAEIVSQLEQTTTETSEKPDLEEVIESPEDSTTEEPLETGSIDPSDETLSSSEAVIEDFDESTQEEEITKEEDLQESDAAEETELPEGDSTSEDLPETDALAGDESSSPQIKEELHPSDPVEDEKIVEELDLGLPAPEETLRKVDALLAGKGLSSTTSKTEISSEKVDPNATTTVVANVMIGIGNKPFLRGEGPGLSWDEGVSMNFIEIGKWAWSPPRKNASLTVQVYRNDQDPDKGGKVVVKPGQKLEITPDFS
jgi:iron-sulfur cluster repair protein YtfE (RIC family)